MIEYKEYRNALGELHRDYDLLAIECCDGEKRWYKNGIEHRDEDRPAIELADGSKSWYVNGHRHRDGDLPAFFWTFNGNIHKMWYKNGQLHREGGLPAVEPISGGHTAWWLNGRKLSQVEVSAYTSFCQRMQEKRKERAQKKIYLTP